MVGAAADQQQDRVGDRPADRGQRPDQRVLALAGDQPGDADDDRAVADAVPGADRAAVDAGVEQVDVDAGREAAQVGQAVQGAVEPGALVVAQVGDDVGTAADAAQQRAGAGQRRPADLVAVGQRDHARDAGPAAQTLGQQAERRRRAEPDRVAVVCRASSAARRATLGVGSSTPVDSRTTSNGWSASNLSAPRQLDA